MGIKGPKRQKYNIRVNIELVTAKNTSILRAEETKGGGWGNQTLKTCRAALLSCDPDLWGKGPAWLVLVIWERSLGWKGRG